MGVQRGSGVWSGRGIRKTHLPAITWTHFFTRNLWLRSHKVERITLRNRSVEPPTVLCSPFISAPNSSTLALSHTIFFLDETTPALLQIAPLNCDKVSLGLQDQVELISRDFFFSLVSRTRHHSCAGHCFTIRSHCNFFRNATIPPGRNKQQRKTKQTATKQNQQRNTNQTQTENQTPEWKLSSLFLYNIQLK